VNELKKFVMESN